MSQTTSAANVSAQLTPVHFKDKGFDESRFCSGVLASIEKLREVRNGTIPTSFFLLVAEIAEPNPSPAIIKRWQKQEGVDPGFAFVIPLSEDGQTVTSALAIGGMEGNISDNYEGVGRAIGSDIGGIEDVTKRSEAIMEGKCGLTFAVKVDITPLPEDEVSLS